MKSATERINIEHFNKEASQYDQQFGLSIEASRARARFIRQHLRGSLPGGDMLDLGCGTGNLTAALVLEELGTRCIGLDIAHEMVQVAREKTKHLPSCAFLVASGAMLPFRDSVFSLCVGDAFLHHVLDVKTCLAEVHRVLKPGGVATFNEPSRDGYAFFEFVLKTMLYASGKNDNELEGYLYLLQFMREHEGDQDALAEFPIPDKHVFSKAAIQSVASEVGFTEVWLVPAVDGYPGLWVDAYRNVLTAVKVSPDVHHLGLGVANLLESVLGDVARQRFCLHNQLFLSKS